MMGLIFSAVCAVASEDENLLNSCPRGSLAFVCFETAVGCPKAIIILFQVFR